MTLFRRFRTGGDGVLEALRERLELEMIEGARGNAENRFTNRAPRVGLGRDFSLIAGDSDVFSGK